MSSNSFVIFPQRGLCFDYVDIATRLRYRGTAYRDVRIDDDGSK